MNFFDLLEKWGGRDLRRKKLFLKQFMIDSQAMDLGFFRHRFS